MDTVAFLKFSSCFVGSIFRYISCCYKWIFLIERIRPYSFIYFGVIPKAVDDYFYFDLSGSRQWRPDKYRPGALKNTIKVPFYIKNWSFPKIESG